MRDGWKLVRICPMAGFDIRSIDPYDVITTILVMKMHYTVTSISAQNLEIFGIEDFCMTYLSTDLIFCLIPPFRSSNIPMSPPFPIT
jgi:hypothetical protein